MDADADAKGGGMLWPPSIRQWVLVSFTDRRAHERRSMWKNGGVQISLHGFQDAYVISMWRCLLSN